MTIVTLDDNGNPVPAFRYGATHKVAFTAGAAGTIANGVDERCKLVLVWADVDCHIAIGAAPAATVNDKPLTAKVDTPVALTPGHKVSAIGQSAAGTLYVTELL